LKIINFNDNYLNYVLTCTHSNKKNIIENEIQEIRKNWIYEYLNKGLIIKIAIDEDNNPLGFIHSIPIIYSSNITGSNYHEIPCLAVSYKNIYSNTRGSGVGKSLLNSIEGELRNISNGITITSYDNDFWFMPYSFFKKMGYNEIDRKNDSVLVVKKFHSSSNPQFKEFLYEYKKIEGKIVVDYYWNSMCPTVIEEYMNIKNVVMQFENIIFNEYNSFNCENNQLKNVRALYINGESIVLEDTLGKEELIEILKKY
jgi:hypothetical protein